MTRQNNSAPISTLTPKPKLMEMPSGLKMALKMFGMNVEAIEDLLNSAMESGDIEAVLKNILSSAETIQRVEKKLDLIIKHLQIAEQ